MSSFVSAPDLCMTPTQIHETLFDFHQDEQGICEVKFIKITTFW